ncbi:putative 3-hydroxyisobutyrate dehydrogenase, mitochondrial isoform X1 [Gossypium australe]|uniref:3-hydroxyisobutyrate dehydrogenase n=1 Tax=Gossypium australe TaxID=47621 RepID=A0A5B6WTI4_9ROSI|nr:putative 3-hydroxyisobutyrate dehydrogenase, mitochondrial isoform X1 [Gossypium australe]
MAMMKMKIYGFRLRALLSTPLSSSPFHSVPSRIFSSSSFENVGFIGLGNMGSRMANNLLKAGYKMTVHDVNCNVMKKYSDMGVSTKQTPFEVAEASDVVITMLPSSSHVLNVYNGPDGLLQGGDLLTPQLFIDSSTVDPQTSRKLAVSVSNCILKEKKENWENPVMLDAPVSGGVVAAEAGSLTFMVGGSEDVYLAAKSLLLSMGKNAIFCGGPGNGSVAKICNNLAMAISMLGLSEALALGQSLGITASTLTKIFNSSSARCKKSGGGARICSIMLKYAQCDSDSYNPVPGVMQGVPSSRNYSGGFASKLMSPTLTLDFNFPISGFPLDLSEDGNIFILTMQAKDLNLAAASAEEVGQRCPLTFLAQNIYTEICNDGHETEDFSCVFQHYYSGKSERN